MPDNKNGSDNPVYGSVGLAELSVTSQKLAEGAIVTQKIRDRNVTTAKLADGAVTADKLSADAVTNALGAGSITSGMLAARNYHASATINSSRTSVGVFTNSSVTITTTGRPVLIILNALLDTSSITVSQSAGTIAAAVISLRRNGSGVSGGQQSLTTAASGAINVTCFCGSLIVCDTPPSGANTYDLYVTSISAGNTVAIGNAQLVAIEL